MPSVLKQDIIEEIKAEKAKVCNLYEIKVN